jgi:hypothetical protein
MKVICDHARTEHCHGACPDQKSCSHISPHRGDFPHPGENDYFPCKNLANEEIYKVKCVQYLGEEKTYIPAPAPELLTAQPRELTLEEIAVAAMQGQLATQSAESGYFAYPYKELVIQSYDIAEAMKSEKERREKKSEERNG